MELGKLAGRISKFQPKRVQAVIININPWFNEGCSKLLDQRKQAKYCVVIKCAAIIDNAMDFSSKQLNVKRNNHIYIPLVRSSSFHFPQWSNCHVNWCLIFPIISALLYLGRELWYYQASSPLPNQHGRKNHL
jgi:hypothetical protein